MDAPRGYCPHCGALGLTEQFCLYDGSPLQQLTEGQFFLGEYIAEERLRAGVVGEIWRGYQPSIKRRVAIKILHARLTENSSVLQRFVNEAIAVNQIDHHNIVSIFSFGSTDDGRPYWVMEYLEGESLASLLARRGQLTYDEIHSIVAPICHALQATHNANIVHRNIKPSNIFLQNAVGEFPTVKLLDFGLAKLCNSEEVCDELTKTGMRLGTPLYMSPEQYLDAKRIDFRSDIYSLGLVLFEMFAGKAPFREFGDTANQVMLRQQNEPPPLLSQVANNRNIPDALDALLLRVLSKKAQERPQSCTALLQELESACALLRNEQEKDIVTLRDVGNVISMADTIVPVQHVSPAPVSPEPAAVIAKKILPPVVAPVAKKKSRSSPRPEAQNSAWMIAGSFFVVSLVFLLIYFDKQRIALLETIALTRPSAPVVAEVPRTVTVRVTSLPSDAEIWLGTQLLGRTPLTIEFSYATQETMLRLQKTGYQEQSVVFVPIANVVQHIVLPSSSYANTNVVPIPTPQEPKETTKPLKTTVPKAVVPEPVVPEPVVLPEKNTKKPRRHPDETFNPFGE